MSNSAYHSNESDGSLQPIDLFKKEISFLREILSLYAIEESFILKGDMEGLAEVRQRIEQIKNEIVSIHTQVLSLESDDECDTAFFLSQIDALNQEMKDKTSCLKNIISPPQVPVKTQKMKQQILTKEIDSNKAA
ncbi:MAG: hypothetical protein K9M07_01080 [Simkaniaceae bacterium]|nr:hypothetical protein [Simkaniaceae bacterium]MCF7851816.1 hypothetical protein [Simkaniaceae bacterium]